MSDFDINLVRSQFPALAKPYIYFDTPGGTQIAKPSLDRINNYLVNSNANHGGEFKTSHDSDLVIDQAREAMADFINAKRPEEIVFGTNMTTLTFSISRSLGHWLEKGDTIVVTRMDHDGNISPWLKLAEDTGCNIHWVDFDVEDFTYRMEDIEAALATKPKIFALNYASNLLGTINPVKKIVKMAHDAGALVYVDAVQYTPHGAVDVQDLDCDFLVCSAYKFFGPHISVLYGKYDLLDKLPAYRVRPAPVDPPCKFETGTGCFENISGLLGTLEYFEWLGKTFGASYEKDLAGKYTGRRLTYKTAMAALRNYEYKLDVKLIKVLQGLPGINIFGITDTARLAERVPTYSFRLPGITPENAAKKLNDSGIFVWNGNNYGLAITLRLGIEETGGVIRVGASHYHTLDEVDRLETALHKIL